jgi:hypothetical protein
MPSLACAATALARASPCDMTNLLNQIDRKMLTLRTGKMILAWAMKYPMSDTSASALLIGAPPIG